MNYVEVRVDSVKRLSRRSIALEKLEKPSTSNSAVLMSFLKVRELTQSAAERSD
jgi:hypothetical protein